MNCITLNEEVMVSDPCYTIPTWCQIKLKNVLPGRYKTNCRITSNSGWGERCSVLLAVHEDYVTQDLSWREHAGDVGVDSGQCGIFCMTSYRNDVLSEGITTPTLDQPFVIPFREDGDKWYEKICKFTLCEPQWGLYDTGVVSSSGIGDGGYRCLVAKHKGKIVGIAIDYLMEKFPNKFLNEII